MVPYSSDPAIIMSDEYSMLRGFYDAVEALLDAPHDVLFSVHETISQWSAADHLYHILLSNSKSLKAARMAALDRGPTVHEGEPNAIGARVLHEGSFGDIEAEAPDSVSPPCDLQRSRLREMYEASRAQFDALKTYVPHLSDGSARIPHPAFGPLKASEWLRFARVHSSHHQEIIQNVLNAARTQDATRRPTTNAGTAGVPAPA
ncbi:MAG: DinB family protein [Longimonas sp.]|uniref:DinB family protein n=1 Tax=Longimonas sp. TaxID=2039626 RepID=UPI00335300F6